MAATDVALRLTRPASERSAAVRWGLATWKFARKKPLGAFGAVMVIIIALVALFSPVITSWYGYRYDQVDLANVLSGPTREHWFGTDENGRDLFARIVAGSQITALVGLGTVLLVGFLAMMVGVTSGYFGRRADFMIQRVVDIWMSFPGIFLILALVAVLQTTTSRGFFGLGRGPELGPNPVDGDWLWYTVPRTTIVIFVLGVVLAGGASRVVRSAVLAVKANPYVEAAEALGATHFRIVMRHVIPNIMPVVIILATVQLGVAVLAEATISFLGIGVTNFPTWGQMLAGRTRELAETNLHLPIFPTIAIFMAVFGFNMLGDALRDVLDPRLRGSR
ncbi:MAG: ABC transporter permease [Chloroflexi bacterium]|nr:ABC transporter permease [Chloroflexota bacterium]